jgi:mercuric ion transport protein
MAKFDFLKNRYAKVGFWGTLVAALCCFSPILIWIFIALGLAGYTAYIDFVVLPILFVFLAILGYGYMQYQKRKISQ